MVLVGQSGRGNMSGARGENEETRRDDSRAVWERPAVRRMAANEAQMGGLKKEDGEDNFS
jgi:hypothetical protein